MRIDEKIKQWEEDHPNRPFFTLEFFPPKTEMGVLNLYDRFDRFSALEPLWIDVTWGAGGSTSTRTLEICSNAWKYHGLEPLMHLTCTNMSEDLLLSTLDQCRKHGIRNILALRGDPPSETGWEPEKAKFRYAIDLVRFIKAHYGEYFCIAVAGYPEGHLENSDPEDDLRRLKDKVDAGASLVLTQLFFDVTKFENFYKKCRKIGISVPILPGILPIQSYAGFKRFTSFCRTYVPEAVLERLEAIKDDDQKVKDYGVEVCMAMCRRLLTFGVLGLHFYTLNLEVSVLRILDGLDFLDIHLPNRELPWRPRGLRARPKSASMGKSYSTNRIPRIGATETDTGTPGSVPSDTDHSEPASIEVEDAHDGLLTSLGENVRPIFWSNRPRSYIHRTSAWDDFPNGRWGPRDSPAYGEPFYSMCADPDARSVQARRAMWKTSLESPNDVIDVFVNYLKFQRPTKRLPWTNETLGEETNLIKKQLIKLNSLGLCTINSQPRVNAALATDPIFGWGPAGGFVYQKAYIEFFCSPEMWKCLHQQLTGSAANRNGLSFMTVSRQGNMITNVESFGGKSPVNAVTWGVFPNSEIRQPTIVDLDSFSAWKDEAFDLWMVEWASIYDEGSRSRKVIEEICSTWYLVNVVDNNLLSGDLFGDLVEMASQKMSPGTS